MKKLILMTAILCCNSFYSQIKTPKPSPTATISQKVGVSNVIVEYSRPGVKGREIFGELVPFGKIWRTGANKATKITFENDCIFGGKEVPKGSYSLFTIPGKGEWQILLNKETELWGSGEYDKEKQVCSITVEANQTENFTESFTIDFGTFKSFSTIMTMKWANTKISIDVKSQGAKKLQKDYMELLNEGPSANDYYNGAKFLVDNTSEFELALEWINMAIDKRPDAFWMLYHKARILSKLGNLDGSIATAGEVIDMASDKKDDYGYIKKSKELIKKIKSK